MFDAYLKSVTSALKRGDATEHTHRPALKTLVESFSKNITATNEPKRIACGAPDYIITKGVTPVGYIEAKDVNVDLDDTEDGEQLKRYRASLRNLILTDYLEFRYYRNGIPALTAKLGKWQKNGVFKKAVDGEKQVADLFKAFLDAEVESVGSPRELAKKMAQLARMIHDLIANAFTDEGDLGDLHAQYEGFKQVLIADLTPAQFADMYAQTICYGLFAARCNHNRTHGAFTRDAAARDLPKTNPFLRKVFQEIAGHNLDDRIAWAVDDLVLLLDRADMSAILEDFGKATRQEDPVVHFYETFLAAYDPKLRETRGVYYTPEPVVSYIVRSVDAILKRDFGLKAGLADSSKVKIKVGTGKAKDKSSKEKLEEREVHRVQILDPATGTGTFLYAVIEQIRESFKGNAGMWPGYVAEHLLPRIYGFELLIAPYAVAHMKLGLQLKDSGYDFESDERLRVYLTNTLEEAHELTGLPLFAQAIAQEAASASSVKKDAPIMVVVGNPPYAGFSQNSGEWIKTLVEDYKRESTGQPLKEHRNWLGNDYIKFIRFAQWRVTQTGYGVVGYITDNSYIDAPTARGMRYHLMTEFDDIFVLNLHGNINRRTKTPDGQNDGNVFDITQGVAVLLLVRRHGSKRKLAKVHYADLWGGREAKYQWLSEKEVGTTNWESATPCAPKFDFLPVKDAGIAKEYSLIPMALNKCFAVGGLGIQSSRDHLVSAFSEKELLAKISEFVSDQTDEEIRHKFFDGKKVASYLPGDTRQWSLSEARRILKKRAWKSEITNWLYRPFDTRPILFDSSMIDWPRPEVTGHLLQANLCLLANRQTKEDFAVFVANGLVERKIAAVYDGSTAFPLWLYPQVKKDLLQEPSGERQVNLSAGFLAEIKSKISRADPEQIFFYLYAILYSPSYRTRYSEFLKRDFPRVPITSDTALFAKLAKLGERLVALHLMKGETDEISRFPVAGSNEVTKVEFTTAAQAELIEGVGPKQRKSAAPPQTNLGRVYINKDQYFDDVPAEVWEYHIGGYQVCQKWLKDRKGRQLSYDDIKHYQGIIAALAETITLQGLIDEAIPSWPLQ